MILSKRVEMLALRAFHPRRADGRELNRERPVAPCGATIKPESGMMELGKKHFGKEN